MSSLDEKMDILSIGIRPLEMAIIERALKWLERTKKKRKAPKEPLEDTS